MVRRGYLSVRLDENLMNEVHAIFSHLGLSTGDALTVIYNQVKIHQGLPFDVKIPNKETIAAMREGENPEKLQRFDSIDEIFRHWDAEPT